MVRYTRLRATHERRAASVSCSASRSALFSSPPLWSQVAEGVDAWYVMYNRRYEPAAAASDAAVATALAAVGYEVRSFGASLIRQAKGLSWLSLPLLAGGLPALSFLIWHTLLLLLHGLDGLCGACNECRHLKGSVDPNCMLVFTSLLAGAVSGMSTPYLPDCLYPCKALHVA